jgi:hypothetical protein
MLTLPQVWGAGGSVCVRAAVRARHVSGPFAVGRIQSEPSYRSSITDLYQVHAPPPLSRFRPGAFQASAVRVSGLRVCACVRACVRVRGLTTIETPNATQSKR